eukprot:3294885-Alexandrium_andersonii.AAC.1
MRLDDGAQALAQDGRRREEASRMGRAACGSGGLPQRRSSRRCRRCRTPRWQDRGAENAGSPGRRK